MALIKRELPAVFRQMSDAIPGYEALRSTGPAGSAMADAARMLSGATTGEAQPVYSIGLDSLAAAGGLEGVREEGWRILKPPAGDANTGAVSEFREGPGGAPHLASISSGTHAGDALAAAAYAATLDPVKQRDYELRALRIPGLLIEAVWLKAGAAGVEDIVIPFQSLHVPLKPGRAYTMSEFRAIVQPLAEERLKFDDSPRQ